MKRTRRAALVVLATAGCVLAAETLGITHSTAKHDVAADENASLGLTEDGIEASGTLFEGTPRSSPATFDIVNQLSEPISVTLESETFRFTAADEAVIVDGGQLHVGNNGNDRLGPGERLANITVDIDPNADVSTSTSSSTVSGTIEITADGAETWIDAELELELENHGLTVERALVDLTQRESGVFEHHWLLEGVETGRFGLEMLRFNYTDIATKRTVDFTESDSLSVSIGVDGTEHPGTIEHRTATRLDVAPEEPLAVDGADVELVLTGTGPPANPGGIDQPSGATVELLGGGFSAHVEGIWQHL